MTEGPTDPQQIETALGDLAKQLAAPEFWPKLRDDPEAAVKSAGINVEALPQGLLGTLRTMSDDELRIVAHVQQVFEGSVRTPAGVAILF